MGTLSGYASPLYADALSEFGTPLPLTRSGGRLLRRNIPATGHHDAMGAYPLFACPDWSGLEDDLAQLADSLVSVTLVADPFGTHSPDLLRRCFPDLCLPYKDHYIVELEHVSLETIHSHHRRNVRRGLRKVKVEFCADPAAHLDEWCRLYRALVKRHRVDGIAAFSETSFRAQLQVPGLVMQRASCEGETVGMILWYLTGRVAYYHLGAYTELGYEARASYVLFWTAFEHFRETADWAALGAAAGASGGKAGGLDRFKAGWATGTRTAWLCGRILSPGHYAALSASHPAASSGYFPAYRAGEFR